ncbi:MAG: Zn-dependent alcohol dehydrogenase [Chloroflexi bacterium]|nr:Zn-dependent alcohol dehydrogenase [Chloroflexota bacterium]
MKTRAAVSYQPGEPLVIEELEMDEPKAGEVLVKVKAVGLCHSDYHVMAGNRPVGMRPMVLGHEGAGIVEKVGAGVTRFKTGDHVVLMFIPSCGKCQYCVSGMTHACVWAINISKGPQLDGTFRLRNKKGQDVGQFCLLGAFSEYVIANENSLCAIDTSYSFESACLVGCGVTGGYGAAVNRAKVTPGSSVLVIGVGGLGMNIVQGARLCGAAKIIAVDVVTKKLEWARSFGATHTIDAGKEDVVTRVMEMTNGVGVHFAFEAISDPKTIAQAFAATAKTGSIIVCGLTPSTVDSLPISPLQLVLMQKTLMGSIYGSSNAQVEIPKILSMYKGGQIKLDELVTRTYALDQINDGYADMNAGLNIRGVVRFD